MQHGKSSTGYVEDDVFAGVKAWHLFVLLLLLLILGSYYVGGVMREAYTVRPAKIFRQSFTNDIQDVQELQGGGQLGSYFNVWLTFKCPKGAHLKEASRFGNSFAGQAQMWFRDRELGSDLQNPDDLELLARSDHDSVVSIINEWLLHNKKTGQYYFRSWGQK